MSAIGLISTSPHRQAGRPAQTTGRGSLLAHPERRAHVRGQLGLGRADGEHRSCGHAGHATGVAVIRPRQRRGVGFARPASADGRLARPGAALAPVPVLDATRHASCCPSRADRERRDRLVSGCFFPSEVRSAGRSSCSPASSDGSAVRGCRRGSSGDAAPPSRRCAQTSASPWREWVPAAGLGRARWSRAAPPVGGRSALPAGRLPAPVARSVGRRRPGAGRRSSRWISPGTGVDVRGSRGDRPRAGGAAARADVEENLVGDLGRALAVLRQRRPHRSRRLRLQRVELPPLLRLRHLGPAPAAARARLSIRVGQRRPALVEHVPADLQRGRRRVGWAAAAARAARCGRAAPAARRSR